jgi:hypothetical protein
MHFLTRPSCCGLLVKFRRRFPGYPVPGTLGSQTGSSLKGGHVMPSLTFTLLMDPPREEQCSCRLANVQNPSLLSCRYFLTPLNTCDSINCFKLSLSLAAPFSMPTPNSAEGFFKRARERGAENETDIINDEEVKKELQLRTKNNYRRALALWYQ